MRFPHRTPADGVTCLESHRERRHSRKKRILYGLLEKICPRSRQSSDLTREDFGDLCRPRQEEWLWNVEVMQAGDDRFNSTRDRNMHLKFIPSAYGQEEEEMNLNAAGRRGVGLHRVCPVDSTPDARSTRRNSQPRTITRFWGFKRRRRRVPDCGSEMPSKRDGIVGRQAADRIPSEHGTNRAEQGRTAICDSQATAVDSSRGNSGTTTTMSMRKG